MAKYDESDLMDAAQGAGLEELASRSFKKRYPGQSRPLPSDSASEDNKKRQDEEAVSVAKRIAKGLIAGPVGVAAEEALKRPPKYDSVMGPDGRFRVPEHLKAKGGAVKIAKGGKVSSASKRADGCAIKGKTRGRMI